MIAMVSSMSYLLYLLNETEPTAELEILSLVHPFPAFVYTSTLQNEAKRQKVSCEQTEKISSHIPSKGFQ
jgi:hypothetical protein